MGARNQSRFTRDLEEMAAYFAQQMGKTAVRELLEGALGSG